MPVKHDLARHGLLPRWNIPDFRSNCPVLHDKLDRQPKSWTDGCVEGNCWFLRNRTYRFQPIPVSRSCIRFHKRVLQTGPKFGL